LKDRVGRQPNVYGLSERRTHTGYLLREQLNPFLFFPSLVVFYKLFKVDGLSFWKHVEKRFRKRLGSTHISLLGRVLQGFWWSENRWI